MKNRKNTILSFTVLYKKDPDGGYVVFVPALPGCHTQGETIEEAEKNIQEAIELYLESVRAHREELPQESSIL
ncbi:antitoxin HicB [Candidatus Roizmanbacteria bacterium RIFCSPHIGHO2_12_FULL_38_13]|nr:MAG: antitoxin HicB [Candidatus Roizmanbacteria bacterium RIFCSPHIGHO2_12_FULL_38_13]